jgi:hypothetical protein
LFCSFIAVAKAIRIKPNAETLTNQSFLFCLLPSALEPFAIQANKGEVCLRFELKAAKSE